MNIARFALLAACAATLGACDQFTNQSSASNPASAPAASQASAPLAASAPKAVNVREAFISACLSTASQQAPADDATMQYCGCVYDEGAKAYGDKAQWDSALAIDKPENMPEKLQKTVASVSDSCSQKFFGVSAASAASAAIASKPASAPAASQAAAKASATAKASAKASAPAAASQPAAASTPANAAASAVAASDASTPAAATTGKRSGGRHRHHSRRR
nr:hypothetical protein [uncultured Kingella sp.]